MNILIIGNGFDLAHGLPTDYGSFLRFVEIVNEFKAHEETLSCFEKSSLLKADKFEKEVRNYISGSFGGDVNKSKYVINVWDEKTSDKNKSDRIKHLEELSKCSENNMWIKWFKKVSFKEKWVDFEAEISRFVQEFEKMIPSLLEKNVDCLPDEDDNSKIIKSFIKKHFPRETKIKEVKSIMESDLNKLIRCLEIYLEDYIGSIDIKQRSPDIDELEADYLLSFNYTDTYKRLYEKNIECCYIHGRARIDSGDDNNMVLGIDDYLT